MRKCLVIGALLVVASCSKPVQVQTEAQFEQNPDLLKSWTDKCQQGEYSNLGAEEKTLMCGSAQSAAAVLTERQAEKDADNSFSNTILRKKPSR